MIKLANNKRHDRRRKSGGSSPYKESIGQINVPTPQTQITASIKPKPIGNMSSSERDSEKGRLRALQ